MKTLARLVSQIAVLALTALTGCGAGDGLEPTSGGEGEGEPIESSGQHLINDDGTWGGWNSGGGVALAHVDGDSRRDLVFARIDAPDGGNSIFYRVGFNVDKVTIPILGSQYKPTSYGPMVKVPGTIGDRTSGAGVAAGDINDNGRPEVIVVYVDDTKGEDTTWYRIGWDLNSSGVASSWSEPRPFTGGFHGWYTAGADVVLRDINGNGKLNLVVATVDDPSEDNVVYWSVGYDLDASGWLTGGTSPTRSKPRGIGWRTSDLGLSVADMNRDNVLDLLVSWTDDAGGQDTHYVQIGYGLDAQGGVQAWGPVRALPGSLTNITHASGIVAHDFTGDGSIDIFSFNLAYDGSGDYASMSLAQDRSDMGIYSLQFKPTQSCLITPGSGVRLEEGACSATDKRQLWTVASMGSGWYSLVNMGNSKCAEIEGGSTDIWSPNLEQQDCFDAPRQKFKPQVSSGGYWNFRNSASNLCVESFYPSSAWITQYNCDTSDSEKIRMIQRN